MRPVSEPSLHNCRLPHASGVKDGALRPRGQPKVLRKSPPRPAILAWLVWPLYVGRVSQRFPTPPGVHPLEGDPALVADKSYIKERIMSMANDPDDELLSMAEVSAIVRAPVATLRYWRHIGSGPRSIKVGRSVRYWRSDVISWLDGLGE